MLTWVEVSATPVHVLCMIFLCKKWKIKKPMNFDKFRISSNFSKILIVLQKRSIFIENSIEIASSCKTPIIFEKSLEIARFSNIFENPRFKSSIASPMNMKKTPQSKLHWTQPNDERKNRWKMAIKRKNMKLLVVSKTSSFFIGFFLFQIVGFLIAKRIFRKFRLLWQFFGNLNRINGIFEKLL